MPAGRPMKEATVPLHNVDISRCPFPLYQRKSPLFRQWPVVLYVFDWNSDVAAFVGLEEDLRCSVGWTEAINQAGLLLE
jgi:hypothetical protein